MFGNEIGLKARVHRGTSLTRKCTTLEPYRRPMPRALGGSQGVGYFLLGEVSLYGGNLFTMRTINVSLGRFRDFSARNPRPIGTRKVENRATGGAKERTNFFMMRTMTGLET